MRYRNRIPGSLKSTNVGSNYPIGEDPTPAPAPAPAPTPNPSPAPAPAPAPAPNPGGHGRGNTTVNKDELATLRAQNAVIESLLAGGKTVDDIRAELEQNAEKLRTEEDKRKIAEKQFQNQLSTANKERDEAVTKYRTKIVDLAIRDAASGKESTSASMRLIVQNLAPLAKIVDGDKVVFPMEVEEHGVKVKKDLTAVEAVAIMESNTDEFGPLFKSFVASGAGGKPNTKVKPDGSPDIANMSMEDYVKFVNENPKAAGVSN